jgi:hypothetical protein
MTHLVHYWHMSVKESSVQKVVPMQMAQTLSNFTQRVKSLEWMSNLILDGQSPLGI